MFLTPWCLASRGWQWEHLVRSGMRLCRPDVMVLSQTHRLCSCRKLRLSPCGLPCEATASHRNTGLMGQGPYRKWRAWPAAAQASAYTSLTGRPYLRDLMLAHGAVGLLRACAATPAEAEAASSNGAPRSLPAGKRYVSLQIWVSGCRVSAAPDFSKPVWVTTVARHPFVTGSNGGVSSSKHGKMRVLVLRVAMVCTLAFTQGLGSCQPVTHQGYGGAHCCRGSSSQRRQ